MHEACGRIRPRCGMGSGARLVRWHTEPTASSSASPSSGIYGITLVHGGGFPGKPLQTPSPLAGGFGSSRLGPAAWSDVVVKAVSGPHEGQIIARLQSGATGIFRVALPPGDYLVMGSSKASERKRVTVHPGAYSRVKVYVAWVI
jgi:hypothetical protein